jgi:hypothetical protein
VRSIPPTELEQIAQWYFAMGALKLLKEVAG